MIGNYDRLHTLSYRLFSELDIAYKSIPFRSSSYGSGSFVPDGQWCGWATSVQHLLRAVFGESSPHYKNFVSAYTTCKGGDYEVRSLQSLFASAKGDFDGGYIFNVELKVSGEVFGDFIVLAHQALSEGHKDVAAVLACSALEDVLKRYAISQNLLVEGKTMTEVINMLKAEGLVVGAQKSLLDTMPRIRNMALHADWEKLSEPDVNSVLGYVEQFLLTKFSGS